MSYQRRLAEIADELIGRPDVESVRSAAAMHHSRRHITVAMVDGRRYRVTRTMVLDGWRPPDWADRAYYSDGVNYGGEA